jgi:DNA-binding protein HU-beta
MNKTDLVNAVAKDTGLSKAAVEGAINSMLGAMRQGIRKGGVQLSGFGSFTVGKRKARKGRNPQTGKALTIPASKVVKFRAAESFRSVL